MGLQFRKSFKIAPGIKVNLGKKSAGISVGNKYGGFSFNSKTGARVRVSAPGTGLSYSSNLGSKKTSKSSREAAFVNNSSEVEPTSLRLDEATLRSLNQIAFQEYVEGYLSYARTITPDSDPVEMDKVAEQLKLINAEFKRRREIFEADKIEREERIQKFYKRKWIYLIFAVVFAISMVFSLSDGIQLIDSIMVIFFVVCLGAFFIGMWND